MILTEFDSEKKAFINPEDIIVPVEGMPRAAIACYSHITFERMLKGLKAEEIAATSTANSVKPVYKAKYKNIEVALFMLDELHVHYTVGKAVSELLRNCS